MEQCPFGKSGIVVSRLGFGGSEIGYHGASPRTVEKILGAAVDAGINVIDTAECYPGSEELLGKALGGRRADFHLFTKCGHSDGFREPEWDPAMLAKTIDRALRRLRTDRLDLVQLHSCSAATLERGEVIEVLERAKQAGKTRLIGYSGDGDAALYAVKSGAFDALQISVSIADQESIDRILPLALERGMGVVAKRPIANAVWRSDRGPSDGYSRPYWDRLKQLDYDFLKSGITESIAIALRFTLSTPGVHTAIVGTVRPERIAENARIVASGALPKSEYDAIRARWTKVARRSWAGQT